MENDGRRTRKSAPVKNAIFLGATHKDKSKSYALKQSSVNTSVDNVNTSSRHRRTTRSRSPSFRNRNFNPSSYPCRRNYTPKSMRMSTPVRNCETSPRYRTRRLSRQGSTSDESLCSLVSSVGSRRRYHPDYDPMIEIRRARERLERFRSKDDWKADVLLSDDADEDLLRYEEKLKRRLAERGDSMEPIELERRQLELLRRQRDIDMGKVTERYAEYVLSVPKPERQKHQPRTPNKFRKVSRRAWDGMIRKWRIHLHEFDNTNFEDSWRSLSSTFMSGQSTPDHSLAFSDFESENADPQKPLASTDYTHSKLLTAPPAIKEEQRNTYRTQIKPDDEDTLQANPKAFNSRYFQLTSVQNDEEDTLSAAPSVLSSSNHGRRVTRSRLSKPSDGPAPDALHSGLTNDLCLMYHSIGKRSAASMDQPKPELIDITDKTAFPELLPGSPSKRARRGILSVNGVNGL